MCWAYNFKQFGCNPRYVTEYLLENNPELSFDGVEDVVEKLVPAKKAALKELNMKALTLGKNYKA